MEFPARGQAEGILPSTSCLQLAGRAGREHRPPGNPGQKLQSTWRPALRRSCGASITPCTLKLNPVNCVKSV